MNSKTQILTQHSIKYGDKKIDFSLYQSKRKTFRIEVSPDFNVIVKAPDHISQAQIIERVTKRSAWIFNQIAYFEDFYPRITPRKYISGETFLYLGKQYILKIEIVEEKEKISLKGKYMLVYKKEKTETKKIIDQWYLEQSKKVFDRYIYPVLDTFKNHNIYPVEIKIRKMKNRRGSCNKKGVITLNSDLLQAPRGCIEYVLTHECCHLVEFKHTKKFYDLLSMTMPDRKKQKNKLEKLLA